jgi:histone-lysine N-methyltransferase SETD8
MERGFQIHIIFKFEEEKKKKAVENHMDKSINKKITDYFTVRKSTRRCASDLEKLKKEEIENAIVNRIETGLEVRHMENKGRGVFATKHFDKNDFVVEYAGELISHAEAKKREHEYATDDSIGCYMYYFEFKNKSYCVDATSEKIKRLGRLLNHSRTSANCHTKLIDMNGVPVLGIYASVDIEPGDELMYDYGDRNRDSVKAHPWLNS